MTSTDTSSPRLAVDGLVAGWAGGTQLAGVDLAVGAGRSVAVVGANGAGKSTLLATVAGLLPVRSGQIRVDGVRVERRSTHRRARLGLRLLSQNRRVFPSMTVDDNVDAVEVELPTGEREAYRTAIESWFEQFPAIGSRREREAGELSGGEQQLLSIGRVLATRPAVLLLDEPSAGLSPAAMASCAEAVRSAADRGTAILLVEQDVAYARELTDEALLLRDGRLEPHDLGA